MGRISRQTDFTQKEILLWYILQKLEQLTKVTGVSAITTTTTTTTAP